MCFTCDVHPNVADTISAVVHVDGTARVQSVRSSNNEIYYDLIRKYKQKTGTPVILNTSYNLKGQPIVETPRDALMTFYGCGLDALIMGDFVVRK
jgi:carbamoyltransferase